jgi:hypothetical protein
VDDDEERRSRLDAPAEPEVEAAGADVVEFSAHREGPARRARPDDGRRERGDEAWCVPPLRVRGDLRLANADALAHLQHYASSRLSE